MTLEEIKTCTVIDELIGDGKSFAIYCIPGEEHPRFLMQTSGAPRHLYKIEDLNEQSGFVIAPFHAGQERPIVLIQPDCWELPTTGTSHKETPSGKFEEVRDTNAFAAYADCFDLFIHALRYGTFEKLVLSRSMTIDRPPAFSAAMAFYSACRHYIHSYVYLCYTPQTGIWLGSTPEIILSGEKGVWNTVALAGTQSLQDGRLPQEWDAKNREEQEYVAAYIRRQLLSLGIHSEENGPYPAYAGALSHLKTDFRFSLSDSQKLGDLLNVLHPTPAVCGLPKEKAYQFILENEGYDRKFYSGFIGWLNPAGKTDLYVNLRCMNVEHESLTLYAGGGLLASSELDDEYQETEKKMQTMLRLTN